MSEAAPGKGGAHCAVTPGARVTRAVASIAVGTFAVINGDNPWCAIPAGVCATFLMIGALTGWCPTSLLSSTRKVNTAPNTLGYAEARQSIKL